MYIYVIQDSFTSTSTYEMVAHDMEDLCNDIGIDYSKASGTEERLLCEDHEIRCIGDYEGEED